MATFPPSAVIVGAGPAGLTAALELLRNSDVAPLVVEASDTVGGLSRTVNYRGFRMDLGGHRFFSRSDWVMDWWQEILPIDPAASGEGERIRLAYRARHRDLDVPATGTGDLADPDRMMLVRNRLSRIYHRRRFFDYPIRLDVRTIVNLGVFRSVRAGLSYLAAQAFPRRPERNLEDFLVNRFGRQLYETFFKSYTEKVWGVPCTGISAAWGAQRIKGLSLTRAVVHAVSRAVGLAPKTAHTSLIERFLYPKFGPGQLWEEVARQVRERGGSIAMNRRVERIELSGGRVVAVDVRVGDSDAVETMRCDYAISTMPVKDLVECMDPPAPADVREIARRLPYRDFIVVGLIARKTAIGANGASAAGGTIPPTTGSTSRSPTSGWAGCRSSTTGARGSCRIPRPCGSGSSTSARKATTSGRRPTRACSRWRSASCSRSASSTRPTCSTASSSASRRRTRRTSAPTSSSASCAPGSTRSRTCSSSAATACTATTTRTTRC